MSESAWPKRPDYRVDILPRRNLVTVRHGDDVIARTSAPLLVDEQDHGLVFYIPEADVNFAFLEPIEHRTRCPYKGYASHWQLAGGPGDGSAPVAWTYSDPYPEVARIRGYVAFYQDRVSLQVGVATPAVLGYER